MSAQYVTLEEFIKQNNLKPVDHKVGVYDSEEDDEPEMGEDVPPPLREGTVNALRSAFLADNGRRGS